MLRIGRKHRQALFTSGATPERARLEGAIPFKARVHSPWERLPGRTPVCGGSDSLHTGAVPKTEHNEGADPKTELKKLNAALLLVCWSVSLLFCRVSFLVGVLPLGPRLCSSAMVSVMRFSRGRTTTPEPITFGRYSFTKLDCVMLWQPGYAVLGTRFSVKRFLVLLATLDGRSH